MEQYINKSKVVAEIERKKAHAQTLGDNAINSSMQQFYDGMREGCNNLLSFINTLEVNKVNSEFLKKYFEETPQEELDKEWKEIEPLNDIGPDVLEYADKIKNG